MARSRNIKPGLFQNEYLVALPFETRLMFAGLPCFADREGRLEDRPMKLKIQMFPADNVDIDSMLQQLNDAGFIQRYTVGNVPYIQIVNFAKHQNPHVKEAESSIPAPDKNSTSTVQAPDKNSSSHADSLNLITDSLNLITDSFQTPTSKPAVSPCPHLEILSLYGEELPELRQPNPNRWQGSAAAKALQTRWREDAVHQSLDFWRDFFRTVKSNPWWMGQNDRGWRADLRWLVKRENFDKVIERWAA